MADDDSTALETLLRRRDQEVTDLRATVASLTAELSAAKTELQDRADWATADHPGYDGTDGAHPAWWRGQAAGVDGAADAIMRVIERGACGSFGSEKLQAVADAVCRLTEERDGLLKELDEEREKVGLLLQPKPTDLPDDFPWQMMRQWCANRDAEKHAERVARIAVTEERDRVTRERDEARAERDDLRAFVHLVGMTSTVETPAIVADTARGLFERYPGLNKVGMS